MIPTLIISMAAFVGVAALVAGVAMLVRSPAEGAIEDRLQVLAGRVSAKDRALAAKEKSVLARPLDDVPSAFEEAVSRFLNIRRLIEQADMSISPAQFLLVSGALAGTGVVSILVTGLPRLLAPILGMMLGSLPLLWILLKRHRRKKAFGKQLPEALDLLARALRAGHSLAAGFHLVQSEMPPPLGTEFGRVYEEQNLGVAMDKALDDLAGRVPNIDLRFFATAVILQRQTGGDLAEILDKIANLIRERFKIYGQIQSLTGEGRLSGIVLLALPPGLALVMYRLNPDYLMLLFTDEIGRKMLLGAVVLQLLGALVIKKIVNIKV